MHDGEQGVRLVLLTALCGSGACTEEDGGRQVEAGQASLFPQDVPTEKLRVLNAIPNALVSTAPERAEGLDSLRFCTSEMKRTKKAWDTFFAVADRLGQVPTVAYNLACYACQLGNLETALEWLEKVFQIGGKQYKLMALDDRDLEPLWQRIALTPLYCVAPIGFERNPLGLRV